MNEYYVDLNIPFFTKELVKDLATICHDAIRTETFSIIEGYRSTEKFVNVDYHQSIKELAKKCSCCTYIVVMVMPPNFVMDIHKDIYYTDTRKSALFLPLLPDKDISPTLYYDSIDSIDPKFKVDWVAGAPKLLNILPHWHNVINNDQWRCMLQFSLNETYDNVIKLIEHEKFFVDIPCSFSQTI